MEHQSVLLAESIALLAIRPDGIYVDGTLGRGGHSSAILKQLTTGHLYAFDKDKTALSASRERLAAINTNFTLIDSDYCYLQSALRTYGVTKIDGLLLDLGVSSPQFDDPQRGFSYRYDTRLDMRMDRDQPLSAYEVVNDYTPAELIRIFREYGEERYAAPIVRRLCAQRASAPIVTTGELVELIKAALPSRELNKKGHPAKQVFQALRIEVNRELTSLAEVLETGLDMLDSGGRLAVISFHSLEDRLVKQAFLNRVKADDLDRRIPIMPQDIAAPTYRLITKKPVTAGAEELKQNNRSHSAKLRVIERL